MAKVHGPATCRVKHDVQMSMENMVYQKVQLPRRSQVIQTSALPELRETRIKGTG